MNWIFSTLAFSTLGSNRLTSVGRLQKLGSFDIEHLVGLKS